VTEPVERATLKPWEWTSSVDLHVLVAGSGRRSGLERAIRAAIRTGRLRPDERLPSTRALARDLGFARGTVAEAYAQLAAEGYLRTRQGAPTRIAPGPWPRAEARQGAPVPTDQPRFSMGGGVPDLSAFPRAAWQAALRRALAKAPDAALSLDDPRGRPELRSALAAYLGRARGVLADPERIVVCAGYTEGLALLAAALRARGTRTVAMENPCLPDHRSVVLAARVRVAPLAVDERGALADVPAAGAVVLTPAHQFPLGATLAPERRAAFVGWARSRDAILIEDDYDGEFRYDRQPVGALQGLDPERIVYAGTASKTLAPGLRLGWLVVPPDLLDEVLAAKRLTGAAHALDQLALAELLSSGGFDRQVRRMRQRYRRRRDQLLALLADHAPAFRPRGIAAGLHLMLELGPGAPGEQELIERAAQRSLALAGMRSYWHGDGGGRAGVILGYSAPAPHEFSATLAALGATLADSGAA
jgi:GntR family transcriptional regulator / MocR family aminotransferase